MKNNWRGTFHRQRNNFSWFLSFSSGYHNIKQEPCHVLAYYNILHYFYKIINLGTTLENNQTYSISGKGYIKLHVKNINQTNGDEYISIAWIVPNDAYFYCSTIFPFSSNNNYVDTSFIIDVNANAPYVLIANWKHNTSVSTFTDTIIPSFIDTTYYDLLY